MRWRGTDSLRRALLRQFLMVAALAVLVMVLLLVLWRLPVARQQTQDELNRVADLTLAQLERSLDNAETLARALAQVVQGRLFLGQKLAADGEFAQLLSHLVSGSVLFDAIYLVDDQFKIRAVAISADIGAPRTELLGNDLSGVEVLRLARAGWETRWSAQFVSPSQGRPVVALVVPLQGGMVMVELSVERLAAFARDDALRDGLLLLVVDANGELVAAPDLDLVRQRTNLANHTLVRAAMDRRRTVDRLDHGGEAYTGTSRHSDRLGWGMVVAYPQRVVDGPMRSALVISLTTLMLALAAGVAFASVLARRMNRQVNDTVDYAAAIAQGHYGAQAHPSGLQEFDRINTSLARMAATIDTRERELAEQQGMFRELVEGTADLVLYFGPDGVLTYSNPSANESLAGPGQTLVGRTIDSLMAPEDMPRVQAWLTRSRVHERVSYRDEMRLQDARGQTHVVAWSANVQRDGDLQAVAYRCIGLDVTAQRAAQEAVARSEARLRAIIDGSPVLAIQWYDRQGRVVDWNPASENLLGWSREQAMGRTLDELIYTPEQAREFLEMLAGVERSGHYAGPYEVEIHTAQGETRVLLSTTFAIPGDHGAPLFVCMDLDITDRRRAEAELRRSERRFQVLFNANPVAVAVLRRDEDDYRYVDVNEAWSKLIGYQREDMQGKALHERRVMHNAAQRWPALRERLERDRRVPLMEAQVQRADGSVFTAEGMIGLVESEGGELVIYSLNDVTEVRRMQADLRALNTELEQRIAKRTESLTLANTELEQALMTVQLAQERLVAQQDRLVQAEKLASLASLVAGVAHELNTPIGNGLMAISTLQDRVRVFEQKVAGGLRRSDLEDFLRQVATGSEIAVRNIERASGLLSSFKQVAVDQTSAQRRRFELSEVVDEILMTLQPTLKRTSHQVTSEVPPGLELDSYPGALGQVLTNLIQNALVHGLEGRENGLIVLRAHAEGERLELSVTDNGRGIPEAIHKQVFDPFFTTKLGQGGSGLGLPIVRNIVTGVLGGDIGFHNRPEGGVVFVLHLPFAAPVARPATETAESGA